MQRYVVVHNALRMVRHFAFCNAFMKEKQLKALLVNHKQDFRRLDASYDAILIDDAGICGISDTCAKGVAFVTQHFVFAELCWRKAPRMTHLVCIHVCIPSCDPSSHSIRT
jgi:hypothetical protein